MKRCAAVKDILNEEDVVGFNRRLQIHDDAYFAG